MTPQPVSPPQQQGTAGIAIAALVLGVLSMCFFPCLLVAVPVGIFAIIKAPTGKGLAAAGLGASFFGLFTGGIMAAIAIPNFIKFQARSKQTECKVQLRAIHTAALSYRAENNELVSDAKKLGVSFEATRYAYVLSETEVKEPTSAQAKGPSAIIAKAVAGRRGLSTLGLTGECPSCDLTVACVGNIDNDDDLDVWSISTSMRQQADGTQVSPGEVYHHYDDVSNDEKPELTAHDTPTLDAAEEEAADDDDGSTVADTVDSLTLSEPTQRQLDKLKVVSIDDLMRMDAAKLKAAAREELTAAMKERGTEWPPPIHPDILDAAHVEKEPALNACYSLALKKNADLGNRVVLAFEVQPTGAVTNAKLEEDDIGDAAFAKCALRATLGWRIAAKPKAVIDVRMPFVFETEE